ncbi:MAG TPA: hypothetical protein VIH82_14575 [Acidimicrobiia bacterium]
MLISRPVLDRIAAGDVDLAFRRWRRPTVKAGGRLRTAAGELAIDTVDVVDPARISAADARRAGYDSVDALRADLERREDGDVYRVQLHLAGPDTRIALRAQEQLSASELAGLDTRLARLDRASRHGPWTLVVLELIASRPATRAPDLAATLGRETAPFKTDVRKLKELGLTESLQVGYRLSPRGVAYLRHARSASARP